MTTTVAVLLAAGKGSRMGTATPKQFLLLGTKPVLEHSVATFSGHPLIDEIAIVTSADYVPAVSAIAERYAKVRKVLVGGEERYLSSRVAVDSYPDDACLLLLHDAARPLVSPAVITRCVAALQTYAACCCAVPASDTIFASPDGEEIAAIPPRAHLYHAQTPQGFHRGVLAQAFALAAGDPSFVPSDDCAVVRCYLPEVPIKVVEGATTNLKLTYPSDLSYASLLLAEGVLDAQQ